MKLSADSLVRQHLAYASDNPEELKRFETIFDHMMHYFTSVLVMSEAEAARVFDQFGSDIADGPEIDGTGHPLYLTLSQTNWLKDHPFPA